MRDECVGLAGGSTATTDGEVATTSCTTTTGEAGGGGVGDVDARVEGVGGRLVLTEGISWTKVVVGAGVGRGEGAGAATISPWEMVGDDNDDAGRS
jgi:hypothetical protein